MSYDWFCFFPECDIVEISNGNTADIVATSNGGDGDGIDSAFVPSNGNERPTITYTVRAVDNDVKFMRFVARVWDVKTIKVFVLDANNGAVSPFNPRDVPVSDKYPTKIDLRLLGTSGVKLRIMLVPTTNGQPKLDDVTIEACYTSGINFH